MRSIFYVAFVAVLIGAGFYFKIVTLDPFSIVIIAMLLENVNYSVRKLIK